jgi:hypothetical protein
MRPIFNLDYGQQDKVVRSYVEQTGKVLKKISFGDGTNTSDDQNTDTEVVSGTTDAAAGTEKAFAHNLGRIPWGYIIVSRDKGAVIYNGVTAFTSTNIYLRASDVSVTFKAIIF